MNVFKTIMPDEDDPNENYPPKGTPEFAIVINITCDQYIVLYHTGRYFHAQINCAGFNGEEIGITNVPDEPGVWVFENGKPWDHKDWETGIVDDYGITGDWRPAIAKDIKDAHITGAFIV